MDHRSELPEFAANFTGEEWVQMLQTLQDEIPDPALDSFVEQASQSLAQQDSNPALPSNDMPRDMLAPEASMSLPGKFPALSSMQLMEQGSHFALPIDNERLWENIATGVSTTSNSSPDKLSAFLPTQPVDGTDFDKRDYPAWTALPLDQLTDCQSITSNLQQGYSLIHQEPNEPNADLFQNVASCVDLSCSTARVSIPQLQSDWENELLANAMLPSEPQNLHKRDTIATPTQILQISAANPSHSRMGFFQQDLSQTQVSASITTNAPAIVVDLSQITEPAFMRATDPTDGRTVTKAENFKCNLKEPSSSDWHMLRPIIHSLYTKHTLSKVRELLKIEYGFKTSEKMLKGRCKKWDQKKYLTPKEMAAVFRRLSIRDSLNKRSEVRVRGKHIPIVEVERYRKRNRLSLRLELSRLRSSTPPDVRVEVYTPPPSAVSTPDHLRLPEVIMRHMRDYILGSFEARIWVSQGDMQGIWPQSASIIVSNINYAFFTALDLSMGGYSQDAEHLLADAYTKYQEFHLQNSQTTLAIPDLFLQIHRYARYKKLELILPAIESFFETFSSSVGPQHPITLTFGCTQSYLQMGEVNALLEGSQIMMESLVDCLTRALGPLHIITIGYRLDCISQVILPNDYARGLSALRDLARSCGEHHGGSNDLCSPEVDLALLKALNLRAYASYQGKIDLVAKILRRIKQHEFPSQWIAYYQERVHSQLCYFWTDQKQFRKAEFHMREAIRISSMAFGSRGVRTLHLQAKFERWLQCSGRVEEALGVRLQRQVALDLLSEAGWSSIYQNATHDDMVQDALETFIVSSSTGVGVVIPITSSWRTLR